MGKGILVDFAGPLAAAVRVGAALSLVSAAAAQGAAEMRKVTAGPQYGASAFHRWMLGADYRKLWTMPIEAEVLDLGKEAGGITAAFRVGGQETKGLALSQKDGRSFTFRALVKDPSNILPEELQNTFVEQLVQDQMAAQNPAAPLVVDELSKAVGVPTQPIRIVVLPDDPALGEFRKDFAGVVGTFAEYPTAADARHAGFEGAVEIIDHMKLYAKLAESPDDRAAVREFLRARLLDIFVSDFDRHRKQWRWARRSGDRLWHPIPEDRDQAFARYDGVLVRAVAGYVPQLRTFGPKYDNIMGLTYNGREQDRWLLPELSRADFREIAIEMKRSLTDEVIDRSARRLPPEWYAIDGTHLAAALRHRRDTLIEEADRYYLFLAHKVDVQCTNASETVRVKYLEGGAVQVDVSRRGAQGQEEGKPYFTRRFTPDETDSVRLYLRGGDDRVVVEGKASHIRLHVIGGPGNDELDDSQGGGTRFHDFQGQDRVAKGPGTSVDTRPYTPPPGPKNAEWIPPRDWGRDWLYLPWAGYSTDYGLFLGSGFATRAYGFRQEPFASEHAFKAGWAFGASQPSVEYEATFHRANSGVRTGVFASYTGLQVLRYYGFGNDSKPEPDDNLNKVRQKEVSFAPSVTLPVAGPLEFTVAPMLQYAQTEHGDRLIDQEKPYGYGNFGQVGGWGRLRIDTRRSLREAAVQLPLRGGATGYPTSGVLVEAIGAVFPKAWDVEKTYGWVEGDASTYLTAGSNGRATLALRVGGKHMLGDKYPFHDAASIGGGGVFSGQDAVRGFRPNRFIGDSSLYANADLRLYLSRFFLALPGEWGVFGFGDVGRVWWNQDPSGADTWHTSWGGGVWIGLLARSNAIAFTVAQSDERTAFTIRAGFSF